MIVLLLFLAFFFVAPVVPASSPGGVSECGFHPSSTCQDPRVHFAQSLDCYVLGARPGEWIGVYSFEGSFGVGCGPLIP